ncbi:nucleoside deaminase [uncultured Litoreibacter sp.]|uniref:nucleoside deaminase n=1 Tax=uncultured Litoreibacter sp. TaxID=1392394 RepID=UPI0026359A71|nr:nucleoside deaminase [uncultured Litoreibacter sp.]
MEFTSHMDIALQEARAAAARGEVPVGAAVVGPDGKVLARAGNRVLDGHNPAGHAEVLAIQEACKIFQSERLTGCSLYVTLEPCAMCASLISQARIARVYYGASDPKSGGVAQGARVFEQAQSHHKPEVYDGLCEAESAALLREFFASKRAR